MIKLFVYGTLLGDYLVASLLGMVTKRTPAILKGFCKQGLNIYESEGDQVEGDIIEITIEQLDILDAYEGSSYTLCKVRPEVDGKIVKCVAYRIL